MLTQGGLASDIVEKPPVGQPGAFGVLELVIFRIHAMRFYKTRFDSFFQ